MIWLWLLICHSWLHLWTVTGVTFYVCQHLEKKKGKKSLQTKSKQYKCCGRQHGRYVFLHISLKIHVSIISFKAHTIVKLSNKVHHR